MKQRALAPAPLTFAIPPPAVIVNKAALEVPPPGAGFATVTLAVPAAAMSEARIVAVS